MTNAPETELIFTCPHCGSKDCAGTGVEVLRNTPHPYKTQKCRACGARFAGWVLGYDPFGFNYHQWDDGERHWRQDMDDYCEVKHTRDDGTSREDGREEFD